MKLRKTLLFFLVLLMLLINANSAMAYSLNGGKWNTNNIWFNDYTSTSYDNNAGYNWSFPSGLSNNIDIGSGSGMPFYSGTTTRSDVAWDGISLLSISGGYFTYAYALDNLWYTIDYTTSQHQGVVTHEFGHCLGLSDLYGPVQAVMQGYTSMRIYTTVQPDDNNGINRLYS